MVILVDVVGGPIDGVKYPLANGYSAFVYPTEENLEGFKGRYLYVRDGDSGESLTPRFVFTPPVLYNGRD